jgi:hypothetical protein
MTSMGVRAGVLACDQVSIACALVVLVGCASRIADKATLQVSQDEGGTFRMGLSFDGDRTPPKCAVVSTTAIAKIDDVPLTMHSPGAPSPPFKISGATFSIPSCGVAWFTANGVQPRHEGEVTVVRVQDGSRVFELRAANLRALVRAEPHAPEVASGARLTLHILPANDPPLRPGSARVEIYRDKERVEVLKDKDIAIQNRSVSFAIPALLSGPYHLSISLAEEPVRASSCLGARQCEIIRYRSVPSIPLIVH